MSLKKYDMNIDRVIGVLSYLYGLNLNEELLSKLRVVIDKVSGKIREIKLNDKLIFTSRASDRYVLPTIEGANLIKDVKYVIVKEDAKKFILEGKSLLVKGVKEVGKCLPGEEVILVDESGEVLAVGRLVLSKEEIESIQRGVVVKVRKVKRS